MSLLSERMRTELERHRDKDARYDLHAATLNFVPTLSEEEKVDLLNDVVYQRMKALAANGVSKLKTKLTAANAQPSLFGNLDGAYALDIGSSYVKETDDLSESEFDRIIKIREDQIEDDQDKLAALTVAREAARPIWKDHPKWTFGQVKAELIRRQRAEKRRAGRGGGK